MPERLVLWGPPVVERVPADPDYADFLPGWVQKCADVGVTKIIGGDKTLALTEAAHAVGIKVDPYVNYNSFPRHGSARVRYGWSLDFLRPPVDRRRGARHHGPSPPHLRQPAGGAPP